MSLSHFTHHGIKAGLLVSLFSLVGPGMAEMKRESVFDLCLSSQRGTAEQCTCLTNQFGETLGDDEQSKVVAEFSGDSLAGGLQINTLRAEGVGKSVGEKKRECGIN